ncbi:hypothetical protein QFC22_004276 [Naganishia vaughanmartiniae]|uniref:Uncharacterized protein n=1 Tax=Naganishia vaughanmartiniae TaxID=1424756 RepID=A0ACC2X1B9_9TREE|nr:hypothetical protein QFC22_004276 [Naganishia vaughanmartiniae]
MDTATPIITTKHSIASAGDLHDATPTLASTAGRQRRASSDGTAADDSDEGGVGPAGGGVGEKQVVRNDVAPAASGPPAGGPAFKKFGHKFSDPAIAPIRKVAIKIIIIYVGLLTVVMWLALPLYWGSFWKASSHSENLTVMILNRDSTSSTSLGSAVVTAGINNRNGNSLNGSLVGRLGFFEGDTANYPDEASVIHSVVENEYWGVVVVNTDATAQLQAARQIGNSTYDPRSAIGFYYAQGRMENAINGLASNSGNATAIQTLASAPRTVTPAISYASHNLRPFSTPTATAVTLINLPFKLPFAAKYTYAGGFFLWWIVLWAGMMAVGLALEFAIVLMTPRFVAFALLPIIIVQVSVVSLPHELQPRLYRYGVATPFYRVSNAVRTIIFNTKNDIGVDFAILLSWAVLSAITVTALTILFRRREERKERVEREKVTSDNA